MRETRWLDELLREVRPLVRSDAPDDPLNGILLQLERIHDSLAAEAEIEQAGERMVNNNEPSPDARCVCGHFESQHVRQPLMCADCARENLPGAFHRFQAAPAPRAPETESHE